MLGLRVRKLIKPNYAIANMNNYESYTDTELASLLAHGDQSAYIECYNRYWKNLFIHACRMLRDEDQAMDIVQDIYSNLWNKRDSLIVNSSIKTYLYTSVRNHVINVINKGKQKDKYLDSIAAFAQKAEFSTDDYVHFKDLAERIDREVDKFSPRMKTIFVLSREDGMSNKDIAEKLDITDHTVKKTINRALKLLRTQISSFF